MTDKAKKTIHMIGHGHIDPTWLWRWMEGYEEVRATFRSALDRMNETPEFKFTASSACFYAWVKDCDPEMFEEVRARIKEGRWDVVGGWWVEPDCNLPGGEAIARQGLYSQRFFKQEFGIQARVGFNPDSFGHAGTFPQLFKKMGIDYYVYMRPDATTEMKYPEGTTFRWQSNDGTQILACVLPEDYVGNEKTLDRIQRLPSNPYLNEGQSHVIGFYGVGNHGGGPTKTAIAQIIEAQGREDCPDVLFSSLEEYFQGFQSTMAEEDIPTIATDLQHHARGCYSVHSESKRLNRFCEHALMTAERFASVAWLLQDHPYPQNRIEEAWKHVLYNQFHDILAGTSLESSYEDTRDQLGAARSMALEITNESLQTMARNIDTTSEGNTVVVVNPLPWPRTQNVAAPTHVERTLEKPLHIVDDADKIVPSQETLGGRIGHVNYSFTAEVPAFGYRCYHVRSGAEEAKPQGQLDGGRDYLENDWWRIEFDPYAGHICRLYDKKNDVETLKSGNVLAAIVDSSDTWSHDYKEFRVEAGRFGNASLELLEMGDVRATVRIVSTFRDSTVDQYVTLYRGVDTIDCTFKINWQERYTMLKLGYETNVADGTAMYDTAYGCQERDTRGHEEPGQQWMDLSGKTGGNDYGFAVLNDSKYGFDIRQDGIMRVTMLRSPAYAHHDPARYNAALPYPIMDQGSQTVQIQLVPHTGGWADAGVVRKAWQLNEPAIVHVESAHAGALPQKASFCEVDAENVVISVLKQSEDGADLVIRGYETAGREAEAKICFGLLGKSVSARFAPHEIKTLRVSTDTWEVREVDLLEE